MIASPYKPVTPDEDLTGRELGGVTVLYLLGHYQHAVWWQCRCQCGREVRRRGPTLKAMPEGGSLLCQKCTAKNGPHPDPTPEELEQRKAEVRAKWSPEEFVKRGGYVPPVELQTVAPVKAKREVAFI